MSNQVETVRNQQYSANVYHLLQQKGSKLKGLVRNETQKGKTSFYDAVGPVEAIELVGRHANTPQMDTPHSRRRVSMKDYAWSDMVDNQDKIRMLVDPTSQYAQAGAWALGRKMDDVIISALGGSAWSGEEGSTEVVFPDARRIASVDTGAYSGLNVDALKQAKFMFDSEEVDPMAKKYVLVTAKQIQDMLGQLEVTNADYNSVKALVQGTVNDFMGFTFVMINRLLLNTDVTKKFSLTTGLVDAGGDVALVTQRKCYAFLGETIILATGQAINGKIDILPAKNYATQVYASMSIGGTRLEEEKVVEIFCNEA